MQFVLDDTKELTLGELLEIREATGKVNCCRMMVNGVRFEPGEALVVGSHWVKGQHLEVEVDRTEWATADIVGHLDELRADIERRAATDDIDRNPNFTIPGEHLAWLTRPSDLKSSLAVDNLLMRCEYRPPSFIARILRRLRRIRQDSTFTK